MAQAVQILRQNEDIEDAPKSISLIIPVYNEADNLPTFLRRIDSLQLKVKKELIIVNDCSTDGSDKLLDAFEFQSPVKIFHLPKNRGKGAAMREGISQASGDIIGVQDADFEYDIDDIQNVIDPILRGKADVSFGSRYKNSQQVHRTYHYLVNRFLTLLSNLSSGLYLTDMETCYKFFRGDIIKNIVLDSDRFGFEPEITAKVSRLKVRVTEVPISYFPRNYLQGKKITWKDGIAALRHIVVYNYFTPKETIFKDKMPEKYLPKGSLWL